MLGIHSDAHCRGCIFFHIKSAICLLDKAAKSPDWGCQVRHSVGRASLKSAEGEMGFVPRGVLPEPKEQAFTKELLTADLMNSIFEDAGEPDISLSGHRPGRHLYTGWPTRWCQTRSSRRLRRNSRKGSANLSDMLAQWVPSCLWLLWRRSSLEWRHLLTCATGFRPIRYGLSLLAPSRA